jgi:hypothetical protein
MTGPAICTDRPAIQSKSPVIAGLFCALIHGNLAPSAPIDLDRAMAGHRIFSISVASVYPHYIAKAEKKGRTKAEVDEIFHWLTGYDQAALEAELANKTTFEDFFANAPRLNPNRSLIKGVVCGIRVENIEDPLMRELRYLDKLIDELAKGKKMEKILRS